MMNRSLVVILLAGSALGSAATYTFRADAASNLATVKIELGSDRTSKRFSMPAWAPGDYAILNYGQYVRSITFRKGGTAVEGAPGDGPNEWRIPEGADTVEYTIAPSRGNFSPNLRIREREVFISGPGVFGWFEGADREPQTLWMMRPDDKWRVECSMRNGTAEPTRVELRARDYDELIDAPIAAGPDVRVHEFEVGGKPHKIVGYGQAAGVDLAAFAALSKGAPEQAIALFGELPYDQYLFMFDFGGPGGGLEHRDSARMGISPRQSPASARGLIYHEYVHTFNVKRIRAEKLGPFDYSKPAITGTLWWLEGVTDYYSEVFLHRAGHITRDDFMAQMQGALQQVSVGAYLQVSADESSRRVWQTRGSFGYGGISYYTKGLAAGAVLDLAIRAHSGGKNSLDNVIRKLWDECKGDQPGYKDERIRELCIEFGGSGLASIYDAMIKKPGTPPMAEALRPWRVVSYANDRGFVFAADAAIPAAFREWPRPLGR